MHIATAIRALPALRDPRSSARRTRSGSRRSTERILGDFRRLSSIEERATGACLRATFVYLTDLFVLYEY